MADSVELFLGEAVEVVFREVAIAKQGCEDQWEDGVAEVEGAVDLVAALTEPAFQLP